MSKVKAKEHENLTDANIKKVMELLELEKPITKKEACEILNISYNTTRLGKIIEQFKEAEAEAIKRRSANRGKPATAYEQQVTIESYLDGDSVSEIAKRLYRSTAFVKDIIERIGVPQKPVGADYVHYGLIPEQCARDEFEPGQVVWCAKRHCMAIVRYEEENRRDKATKYYRIYVIEPIENTEGLLFRMDGYGGFYDGAYAYDLGSLDHLKEYGVDVYRPYRAVFKNWLAGK